MRVALAQMNVLSNQPRKNLETMLTFVEQAKQQNAHVIAFPEMAVGGYLLGDKWLDEHFCEYLMSFNQALQQASDGITIAYGNIFVHNQKGHHPNKDGRKRKYNAVYVFQNGKPVKHAIESVLPDGIHPKTLLPNYRIFDDERYFFSLQDIAQDENVSVASLSQPFLIEVDGKITPIGFELCEDLWCEDYRQNAKALNPTKMLIENGATKIINISASPWTYGKNVARDRRVQFLKKDIDTFVPFFYVNKVGAQNNGKNIVTFDGGSTVYNEKAQPIVFAKKPYLEELLVIDDTKTSTSLERKTEKPIEEKFEAIVQGIRSFKDMIGASEQPRYVVGLSGGIDSAVVAALLTYALGPDHVIAVNMPTKYNSKKTKNAAAHVASALEIPYHQIPIGELVDVNTQILQTDFTGTGQLLSSLNEENIQAKIRGTNMLSNIAAKYNALFTNNGNKVEIAIGYVTLYGDMGGAIAPLGDLTKAEIFAFAPHINAVFKKQVIPPELLPNELYEFTKEQIEPSAELKENQVDPIKVGYHCALIEAFTDYRKKTAEDVLEWYLQGTIEKNLRIPSALVKRHGLLDPKEFVQDLERFSSLIEKNVFKRIQAPPIIITSKSAYGYDIRESILPYEPTKKFEQLKEQVLTLTSYGGHHA